MITHLPSMCLLTLALALASCQTTPPAPVNIPADVDLVITKRDEVDRNPSAYVGKKVFVQGVVKEMLSEDAFLLDYDGTWGFSRILVVRPEPSPDSHLRQRGKVEVIGDVHLFNAQELERRLGRQVDHNLFAKYQNTPFILTESVLTR